jgi:hypothetical protein
LGFSLEDLFKLIHRRQALMASNRTEDKTKDAS